MHDERNLWRMCMFYRAFPILNALHPELSWTHYRSLLRLDDAKVREWYMTEVAIQNWSTRALDRQISTLYYDRLPMSQEKSEVVAEANAKLVLPSEEEFRQEQERERASLIEQMQVGEED